jgi:hypothetical protein
MEEYSLVLRNDGSVTRRPNGDLPARPSVIDLKLASPLSSHQVVGWKILSDDDCASSTDHEVIEWEFQGSDN